MSNPNLDTNLKALRILKKDIMKELEEEYPERADEIADILRIHAI